MVLRGALLGLLALRPSSGYELARALRGPLAHVWTAGHGQVYPELGRLEESGDIAVVATGPRGRRTYGITPAGRQSLRAWLLEDEPLRDSRNEALLRIFFLGTLTRAEARRYVLAEANARRARLRQYEEDRAKPPRDLDPAMAWSRHLLEWGIEYERALIRWLEWSADNLPDPVPSR